MAASQPARPKRKKTKSLARKDMGKNVDFDIYLNEAVMPVLAQALDSLCRQLTRMDEQGDQLDPKVRARFNPVMWLGQQLLRRHPKCARTPRRQGIYRSFSSWADQERGRREMLRNQDVVEKVFKGFLFRGEVARETIPAVLESIDDTLQVGGCLKGNQEMARALCHAPVSGDLEGTLNGKSGVRQKSSKVG